MKKNLSMFIILTLFLIIIEYFSNCNNTSVADYIAIGNPTNFNITTLSTNISDITTSITSTFISVSTSTSTSTISSTSSSTKDTTPPTDEVLHPSSSSSNNIVTLSWTNPTNDTDFDHVTIVRKQGSAPSDSSDGTEVYSGTNTTYTDTTITSDGTYYYVIYTCDANNNCMITGMTVSEVILFCPLSAPINVQATDGTHADKVAITWDTVTDAEGYIVYRSEDDITYTTLFVTPIINANYNDTSISIGISYYYKVSATKTGCSETSQSTYNSGVAVAPIYFGAGHPNGANGNELVTIAATTGYPDPASSEFKIGGTGGPTEWGPVAINTFDINKYEITNVEYQRNFFDLNGNGVLDDSAYFNGSLVGPSGLTAQQSWYLALDMNGIAGTERAVTIHSTNGVTLGTATAGTDDQVSYVYSNIKGPGPNLTNGIQGAPYWSSGTATPWSSGTYASYSNGQYKSVIYVSWYEARAYCKFVYGSNGDLPSEAQWERAAKGTNSTDYRYPWGNVAATVCIHANYNGCNGGADIVGSYIAGVTAWPGNPGLYDMAGNAYEWCHTWKDSYPYEGGVSGTNWNNGLNPSKALKGSSLMRSLRGGDFNGADFYMQTAYRNDDNYPRNRYNINGFRCIVNP